MGNKDKNNLVVLAAEIVGISLSLDEDTLKNNPKSYHKRQDRIKVLANQIKNAKDPHKNDSRTNYKKENSEEIEKLEHELRVIFDMPHRQTNEWNELLHQTLAKYLKLQNKRLFKVL